MVHVGYWQNFQRKTGNGEDWTLYFTETDSGNRKHQPKA